MKELNKSFISWILSRIVLWLAMWILPALIKIVNQSWTCLCWNIPFKYIWSPSFMELPSHPDMDLILCSKRLIVLLHGSSQLVKSDREQKCIGIINDVHFITHIHAVKCTFDLQNRWSHSQSWWCASFQHSFTFSRVSTSVDNHV